MTTSRRSANVVMNPFDLLYFVFFFFRNVCMLVVFLFPRPMSFISGEITRRPSLRAAGMGLK